MTRTAITATPPTPPTPPTTTIIVTERRSNSVADGAVLLVYSSSTVAVSTYVLASLARSAAESKAGDKKSLPANFDCVLAQAEHLAHCTVQQPLPATSVGKPMSHVLPSGALGGTHACNPLF